LKNLIIGDVMTIQAPDGTMVEVEVPEGTVVGQMLTVDYQPTFTNMPNQVILFNSSLFNTYWGYFFIGV